MRNEPRRGEVTLKQFVFDTAAAAHVTPSCIYQKLARGMIKVSSRRVNRRVIFVKPETVSVAASVQTPLPGEMRFGEFSKMESERTGLTPRCIQQRIYRGIMNVKLRRINQRILFVSVCPI